MRLQIPFFVIICYHIATGAAIRNCVDSLKLKNELHIRRKLIPNFLAPDVVVIGGGHSGCEAAAASARVGAKTLLLTSRLSSIGEMSCNPSIGGVGKGNIVCEIDALDGIMGLAADEGGIMFHLLNRSKGPAVQGPRSQQDRDIYAATVRKMLSEYPNLIIMEAMAHDIIFEGNTVVGVQLSDNNTISCKSVVVTTGTFLRGRCHVSKDMHMGGRMDRFNNEFEPPSDGLCSTFERLGIQTGRFKTGTPPRLSKDSIDFSQLDIHNGDDEPTAFSQLNAEHGPPLKNGTIQCFKTRTNDKVHEIVQDNLHTLPNYESGYGKGLGPRYCISIASKVQRFPHHSSHIVWLEPEGISSNLIYPNGLSGAFPEHVQLNLLRAIKGLENAVITTPAYDVEYNYVNPKQLDHTLRMENTKGLYFAGQICGTTGYEEAAGLGIVAGANAAISALGCAPAFVLNRSDGYIGVLVDDLVTRGTSEPYRMFTSRAEDRLFLRIDNADLRLVEKGVKCGLIKNQLRLDLIKEKYAYSQAIFNVLGEHKLPINKWTCGKIDCTDLKSGWDMLNINKTTLDEILDVLFSKCNVENVKKGKSLPQLSHAEITGLCFSFSDLNKYFEAAQNVSMEKLKSKIPNHISATVIGQAKYGPFVNRNRNLIERIHRGRAIPIKPDLVLSRYIIQLMRICDREKFAFLSSEEVEILNKNRPATIQEAANLPGITIASLSLLASYILKNFSLKI
ncbi:bifunctional MnmG [Babesia duncani]|uniref:Bifunctional MnmG n=1 Tax=Babesia duncani TaxID=323732 RepID=A0AAD9PM26_9APIC|nr:bifunctional MnmG [Babesia duncani]